jgi:hypothetical protein
MGGGSAARPVVFLWGVGWGAEPRFAVAWTIQSRRKAPAQATAVNLWRLKAAGAGRYGRSGGGLPFRPAFLERGGV